MTDLDRRLAARSVAVVGASARPGSFGERLAIEALRSTGVREVHLVNPTNDSVQNRRCVPSLADLPGPVDLVLMGVPDRHLIEQLALARQCGTGGAVVYGSAVGLSASIGQLGSELGHHRLDTQRATVSSSAGQPDEMPICGAGCMGFVNVTHDLRALGYLEREHLVPGGIALITHSGSMFSALLRTHRRLEFSVAISSGQELVTTTGDYLHWILDQPQTRVVGLFLETIREAPVLREGLARAAACDIPVVALTVGRSATGRAMVTAHSGAIAGQDAAWEALFATYGVHRCRDIEEFVDTLELFAVGRRIRRQPASDRWTPGRKSPMTTGIATIHDSGAERVLMADLAADEEVPFAEFGAETRRRLGEALDEGLAVTNPLDVWGRGADTEALFTECLGAATADANVDLVALAVDMVEEYDGDEAYPRAVTATAAATNKPVVVISHIAASVDQTQAERLRAAGIPVLEGARSGLRAIRHLMDHQAVRITEPSFAVRPAGSTVTPMTPRRLAGWLNAVDSLQLLAEHGIDVVPTLAADSATSAAAAAASLGYPVVLKTDEPGIAHRVAVGGVHLGLRDGPAVHAAYAALAARCGPAVAVQPQLSARAPRVAGHESRPPTRAPVELALGSVFDESVGHVMMIAAGGSQIEELSERVLALAPLREPWIGHLTYRWQARTGHQAPLGLAGALTGLSHLIENFGDQLLAVDINPLLAVEGRLVAVDALIQARC
ncbi:MAG: acetate--CoA ligase family protein [Nocardioides sp.]